MNPTLFDQIADRERTLEHLCKWLVRHLRIRRGSDEIDPDVVLFGSGLGLDSVDTMDLVTGVELEFGVILPDGERLVRALRTVNSLLDLILELKGNR